jgi:hypothetical protein
MFAAVDGQPNPTRHEDAQNMSMGEHYDVAIGGASPGNHPIDPGAHLLRRFAAGASVPEDEPARSDLVDLNGRQAFVIAIVPLDQIGIDDRSITEAR